VELYFELSAHEDVWMLVAAQLVSREQHLLHCCIILYCEYQLCIRVRAHTLLSVYKMIFEREIWRTNSCGKTNYQGKVTKHCKPTRQLNVP